MLTEEELKALEERKKKEDAEKLNENPQTPEDYTKNLGILVQRSEAETKDFKETVEKGNKKVEDLTKEVTELKGEIERVRVNVPPILDASGNKIPETDITKTLGMTNEERKDTFEWWKNGPVYDALRKMGRVSPLDQKEHDDYIQKMQPVWAQKAVESPAFQGLNNPKAPRMQRDKAVVTGSMGIEQTGYGAEWAPGVLGGKIIALATYDSVILQEAQKYPVSVQKAWWPTADYSEFACKWPATELDATQENPDRIATSHFALESKWGYTLALLGRQFIINCRQYGIAAVDSVLTFTKHATAVKMDQTGWAGATATHVCDGLEVDSSITDLELGAGDDTFLEVIYTDLFTMKYNLPKRYRPNAKFYGSGKFVSRVRVMEDTQGNLINPAMHMPNPLGVDGSPVVEAEYANDTEGEGECVCIYGNLKDTFAYGFLEDMIFESTSEKYWVEGGVLFRLEFWADMGVTLPTALRRLLFYTTP